MYEEKRLYARPVSYLRCAQTQMVVGLLYEWNTGERQKAWIEKPSKDIYVEPIDM